MFVKKASKNGENNSIDYGKVCFVNSSTGKLFALQGARGVPDKR